MGAEEILHLVVIQTPTRMTVQHEGSVLRHPVKQHRVYSPIKAPKTAPAVRKVYGENSDNSDYGELRAIVRRIEMNQNESSKKSDNLLPRESPATVTAKKKLVFDYVPASIMMKK